MKNKLIMLCMVLLANMAVYAQTQSSYDLIERITPGYSDQFTIEINPDNNGGEDYFEIGSKDGKVLIK
ncbi:MAG: alpha-N-acetylglucosaminidase N-terminal domain-containing protein, partial [Tannerellaceae bacterium]